jgi:hypothetical protein
MDLAFGLKENVKINNNRLIRVSRYLLETTHVSNYSFNNLLNIGIKIFDKTKNSYDKNYIISVKNKNRLKNVNN